MSYLGKSTSYSAICRVLVTGLMVCGSAALARNDSPLQESVGSVAGSGATLGRVTAIMPDSEGGLLITGGFDLLAGQPRRRFCRLDSQGALSHGGPPLRADWSHNFRQGVSAVLFSPFAPIQLVGQGSSVQHNGSNLNASSGVALRSFGEAWFRPNLIGALIGTLHCVSADQTGRVLVGGNGSAGSLPGGGLWRTLTDGVTVDTSFAADLIVANSVALLANGKMVVGTLSFTDETKNLVRLNENGSLDGTFSVTINGQVNCVVETPAGELWIAGNFSTVGGATRSRLAKLTASGALIGGVAPTVNGEVRSLSLQRDGKLLIGGDFTQVNGTTRQGLARLMPDGTLDSSFDPGNMGSVWGVAMQEDGVILVGGSMGAARLPNPTLGGLDDLVLTSSTATWQMGDGAPALSRVVFESWTAGAGWQTLGGGTSTSVGWEVSLAGVPNAACVRARGLLRGGYRSGSTVEVVRTAYVAGAEYPAIEVTDDTGAVLKNRLSTLDAGTVTMPGSFPAPRMLRIRNVGTAPLELAQRMTIATSPHVLGGTNGQARTLAPGEWFWTETTISPRRLGEHASGFVFNSNAVNEPELRVAVRVNIEDPLALAYILPHYNPSHTVTVALPAGDTRTVVARGFVTYSGTQGPLFNDMVIHEVIEDGVTIVSGPNISTPIQCAASLPDGSVLMGGTILGSRGILRWSPGGSGLDLSFKGLKSEEVSQFPSIRCILALPDGRVLLGGRFRIRQSGRIFSAIDAAVIRVLPDGSLDSTYQLIQESKTATSMVIQDDGKVVVALGPPAGAVVLKRLLPNGGSDAGFELVIPDRIQALGLDSEGRVVVGLGGGAGVKRLTSAGAWEGDFQVNAGASIETLFLRADGRILAGGTGIGGFSQHQSNGSAETLGFRRYEPINTNDSLVTTLMAQDDGRLLVGGAFVDFGQVPRQRLVRWPSTVAAINELKVNSSGEVIWERGGASGVLQGVVFERWSGEGWQRMGNTVREEGQMRAAGAVAPVNGFIRARGWMAGGWRGTSGRLVEKVLQLGHPVTPELVVQRQDGSVVSEREVVGAFLRYGDKAPALLRFKLVNAGAAPLTGIRIPPVEGFVVQACPKTLAVGEEGEVILRRTQEQSVNSALVIESHDPVKPIRHFQIAGALGSVVGVGLTDERGNAVPRLDRFAMGAGRVGKVVTRTLRLKNEGTVALSSISTAVTGAVGNWLTVTSTGNGTLAAGATVQLRLAGTIPFGGLHEATLTITGSNGLAAYPITVELGGVEPVLVSQHPQPRLALSGETVTLSTAATGLPTPSFQWRHQGLPVAGATGPTLTIPAARLRDGGRYDCLVESRAGSWRSRVTTDAADVTVLEARSLQLVVETGKKATFPQLISGPGVVSWTLSGAPTTRVTGPPYELTNAALSDSGTYRATVTVPGQGSLESGPLEVKVFFAGPQLQLTTGQSLPQGRVAAPYLFEVPVNPDPTRAPSRFAAKGLPKGLVIDPQTGVISGRPTVPSAEPYAITVTASNARGKDERQVTLPVIEMPPGLVGNYEGFIGRHAINNELGGRFALKITRDGQFSGQLTLGRQKNALRGSLEIDENGVVLPQGLAALRGRLAGVTVHFGVDVGSQVLTQLKVETASGDWVDGEGWKVGNPGSLVGVYTFKTDYLAGDGFEGSDLTPQGLGFGTLRVAASGRVTMKGRMPDGSALSSGGQLGLGGQVPVLQMRSWGRAQGSVLGILELGDGPTPAMDDNVLEGSLSQTKPATKEGLYPLGFGPLEWRATGGSYAPPEWWFGVPAAGQELLSLLFERGGQERSSTLPDRYLNVTLRNQLVVNPQPDAEGITLLSVNKRTGMIKGSFILVDEDPVRTANGRIKKITRRVPFQGIAVREGNNWSGAGFFTLRQLSPVTLTGERADSKKPGNWTGRMRIVKR
jgi:uncharacterized delta-60 repeat protein